MKRCSKCGGEYPETSEYFGKSSRGKNGLKGWCKPCIAEYGKMRREKYPDYGKVHYQDNKEAYAANSKLWEQNNHDKVREDHKKWRENNLERQRELERLYRKNHPETHLMSCKKYLESHPTERSASNRKWSQNNPDKIRVKTQRRISKKNLLLSTLTVDQWQLIKKSFDNKCCYCGKENPLAQEHFIPMSNDGEYTHNNILPACKSCNSSKGTKDFALWYPLFKHYNKKREQEILKFLNYKGETQQLALF